MSEYILLVLSCLLILYIIYYIGVHTSLLGSHEGFTSILAIKDLPPRLKPSLLQELENKWGFIPTSPTLTGSSQTKTYEDIYGYWDPNYNYSDYWNYGYPLLVYPRRGYPDYRPFGHSLYSWGSRSLSTLATGI